MRFSDEDFEAYGRRAEERRGAELSWSRTAPGVTRGGLWIFYFVLFCFVIFCSVSSDEGRGARECFNCGGRGRKGIGEGAEMFDLMVTMVVRDDCSGRESW